MVVKISTPKITIADLVDGYNDGGEDNRVVAFGGKLNVRPAYQRQFVYEPDDRNNVLRSVYNGLPLNSIYWAVNDDGSYEVIDGQQRIISICQYLTDNDGSGNPIAINFNGKNSQRFENLSPEKQKQIKEYPLQVYVCHGNHDEKLEWFHTINIAGKEMTGQELRNADYTGNWLTKAKSYFSKKRNNPAINYAFYDNNERNTLLSKSSDDANRQLLLELVLQWIVDSKDECCITKYMANHCKDENAQELWEYFTAVIDWVKKLFTEYNKDMKGLDWGFLYNKYKDNSYNSEKIQETLNYLYSIWNEDPDGLKKAGFYEYALSGDRTLIWHRAFSDKQQRQAYKNQNEKCAHCNKDFAFEALEAHHKVAYADGGETTITNCLMLCHDCHADITARQNQK